jgi:hypothetical protein
MPKSSFFPAQTVPRHMASFASYRLLAPSALPLFSNSQKSYFKISKKSEKKSYK